MGGHDRGVWCTVLLGALGVAGCASGPLAPLRYEFIDPAPGGLRELPATAATVSAAVDPSTLEPDVRLLASPALQGRRRGTEGNRLARAHIIRRLRAADERWFRMGTRDPYPVRSDGQLPLL